MMFEEIKAIQRGDFQRMPAFKSADSYRRFAKKVKSSRRYLRDAEDREFFCGTVAAGPSGGS